MDVITYSRFKLIHISKKGLRLSALTIQNLPILTSQLPHATANDLIQKYLYLGIYICIQTECLQKYLAEIAINWIDLICQVVIYFCWIVLSDFKSYEKLPIM